MFILRHLAVAGLVATATLTPTASSAEGASLPPAVAATGAEGEFHPIAPVRVYDSRDIGAIPAGQVRNVTVAGLVGLPASGIQAVALNVTVDRPTADSYLSVFARDDLTTNPQTSNLNFRAGQTTPNMVITRLGIAGQISIFNGAGMSDVLVDVMGWFNSAGGIRGSLYHTTTPSRLFDTRVDVRSDGTKRPVGPNDLVVYSPTGNAPSSTAKLTAMMLNVTATNQTEASYLQVFPFTSPSNLPTTSNLNFRPGQGAVPNAVITMVNPADGAIGFYNYTGQADIVADKFGYFDDGTEQPFGLLYRVLPKPVRVVDTRVGLSPSGSLSSNKFTLTAGETRTVKVAGDAASGLPAGVVAAVLNVTADRPSSAGFISVYPADQAAADGQKTSTLNFTPGVTVPNLSIAPLALGAKSTGQITIYNGSPGIVDILLDVFGYFVAD
jgi:hypothetical protein